jgi:hypothetical protein
VIMFDCSHIYKTRVCSGIICIVDGRAHGHAAFGGHREGKCGKEHARAKAERQRGCAIGHQVAAYQTSQFKCSAIADTLRFY